MFANRAKVCHIQWPLSPPSIPSTSLALKMLQRRYLSSKSEIKSKRWRIQQVTKSNFNELLEEVKTHISNSDFLAVSLQNTGSYSAPWQKVLPFDTPDIAYLKAKYAAERFQVLQFALCPFTLRASKLTAHPYNFHLFPRDELRNGMPSYTFSCQTSYLTSMARVGFDFNTCIYDGISYLSRAQESVAKHQMRKPKLAFEAIEPAPASSIADKIFAERTKSRVRCWQESFKKSTSNFEDPLVSSLRKLAYRGEEYGSRSCLDIEVCSERQVQLVIEVLKEFSDELVPLLVPGKHGENQAVRIIWTCSKEDKSLFEGEVKEQEETEAKRVRGFREVIDLISASEKPVVAHNSLDVFAFIHSKFFGPLPSSIGEFQLSLRSLFPCILDLNHLMKEINPMKRLHNLPAALAYLRNRIFSPIDIEIPYQDSTTEDNGAKKIHGHGVIQTSQLFGKLWSILKPSRDTLQADYANTFSPCSLGSPERSDEEVSVSSSSSNLRKLRCEDLVFLWGFREGASARELKSLLSKTTHQVFLAEEFDVRLVDKSSAAIAFWHPGLSGIFLEEMSSGGANCQSLREMISGGLKAANYETYKSICGMGIWDLALADCLDKAVISSVDSLPKPKPDREWRGLEIYWDDDTVTNLEHH
ncbi:hypothetical protein Dimus_016940 [Dionaea muscipula]